ncbi:MAG: hypothetical protein OEV93_04215 [Candidatus Moranbacteria bacterium]|nr:hypothetical protein [Candidatus Moranbacteria bacterium]
MLMGCLFLFWILLGSWRQAVAAVSVISLSFGFGRGFIGVCDTFLFEMSSDTFTIIAFFAIIIPSTSINFHHLKTFNATRKEGFDTEASYWRRWDEAIKSISVIKLIVFVSAIDFLWTMTFKNLHGSRSVMDMGIVAAFGITVSWLLARFFLPVLLGFLGGKTESVKENQSALSLWVNQKTAYVVRVAQRWAAWRHSWKVSLGALLVVVLAAVGLYQYYINTNNNPTEFEKNTMAEAITKKLNLLGRPGASLYSPVVQVDLSDAKSLDQLREYLGTVSGFSRTTYSPFYDFMVVLGDYGYKTGDSIEEVIRNEAKLSLKDAASELSSENIDKEMQLIISDIWKMMWDNDGNLLKFFVSSPYGDKFNNIVVMLTDAGESTPEIRAFRDRFVEAGEGFDLIKIHPASKLSQWPDNDEYVTDGNLKYNFLSQVVVVIFCLIYFLGKDWAGGVKSLTKVACFAGIILALKCGLLVSVPFFWALAVMYLVMMIFRIPLDIASSAISSMAVSIAVDFPLMIIDRFRSLKQEGSFEKVIMSEEMNEVGVSVAFDSIANAFLLSALLAVKITPVVRLGVLEEVVILSCVTGTMFLVFPFLRWIHR